MVTHQPREPRRKAKGEPVGEEEAARVAPARAKTDKPAAEAVADQVRDRAKSPPVPKPAVQLHAEGPSVGRPDPATVASRLGSSVALPTAIAGRFSRAYGAPMNDVRVHPESPVPGA